MANAKTEVTVKLTKQQSRDLYVLLKAKGGFDAELRLIEAAGKASGDRVDVTLEWGRWVFVYRATEDIREVACSISVQGYLSKQIDGLM